MLETYTEDDELKIGLAEIEIEANNVDEAMEWLLQVSEISESYPQALLVHADLYQVLGLYEASEQKLLVAKELLPEEPVINFALAELYFSMGKYAQAVHGYEEIMAQGYNEFSGITLASRCGASYSALGDLEQAALYFEQSVEENETVDALFELGITYYQQREFKRANELFFKLKELDPSYTSVYPNLARGLEEENQLEAYSSLNQNKEFLKNYIYFLRESGERVVIKTVLSEYLVLDPSDGEMLEILEAINTNY